MRTISYDNTFGMVDLAVYTNLMAEDRSEERRVGKECL